MLLTGQIAYILALLAEMSKRRGAAGTLDAFLVRAESLLTHEIELTERRLSFDPSSLRARLSLGGQGHDEVVDDCTQNGYSDITGLSSSSPASCSVVPVNVPSHNTRSQTVPLQKTIKQQTHPGKIVKRRRNMGLTKTKSLPIKTAKSAISVPVQMAILTKSIGTQTNALITNVDNNSQTALTGPVISPDSVPTSDVNTPTDLKALIKTNFDVLWGKLEFLTKELAQLKGEKDAIDHSIGRVRLTQTSISSTQDNVPQLVHMQNANVGNHNIPVLSASINHRERQMAQQPKELGPNPIPGSCDISQQYPNGFNPVKETPSDPGIVHNRPSLDTLNLPPASSPYVLVLAGVPNLVGDQRESWSDLRNKSVDWLCKHKGFHPSDMNDIIMARRVAWIGQSAKDIRGDCIVLNFRRPYMVKRLLNIFEFHPRSNTAISALPLGYFYKPLQRSVGTTDFSLHLTNRYNVLSSLDTQD